MKRKLKIAAAIVAGLALIAILLIVALFFRTDLSREQLSEYVNDESAFLELPSSATAHYRDQGNPDGQVIVLLHGGLGSLHNWEPWMEFLKEDYRVVTIDLPAHGLTGRIPGDVYTRESMVEFVHEFLNELEVVEFSLGGHSMGGGVALLYALEYPEQIESMILVGPEGVPGDEGYDPDGIFLDEDNATERKVELGDVSLSMTDRVLTYFSSPWIVGETLKYMMVQDSLVTAEFADEFARIIRHTGNRYAVALMFRQYALTAHDPRDLEPRLGEISVPVLLQIGRGDKLVPPKVGEKFHAGLPDSQLKIYENCGHMIQWEVKEKSAKDVVAFLRNAARRPMSRKPQPTQTKRSNRRETVHLLLGKAELGGGRHLTVGLHLESMHAWIETAGIARRHVESLFPDERIYRVQVDCFAFKHLAVWLPARPDVVHHPIDE